MHLWMCAASLHLGHLICPAPVLSGDPPVAVVHHGRDAPKPYDETQVRSVRVDAKVVARVAKVIGAVHVEDGGMAGEGFGEREAGGTAEAGL